MEAHPPRGFGSDNHSGAHPSIIDAITEANTEHTKAYGGDPWTQRAIQEFRRLFDHPVDVYMVMNGTGANVLAAATVCRSFEAIIATDTSHIHSDECGAPEKVTGSKILLCQNESGKLTPARILEHLQGPTDQHWVKPRMISITQSTECGTVYTPNEIKAISLLAREHKLLLHMDGARISNAIAFLDIGLKEMIVDCGVDIVSFGGTKNGMLYGEAVVFVNTSLGETFPYTRKQGMQLVSKMRFVSSQFLGFFKDNLWLDNARHANSMASLLAEQACSIPGIELQYPTESNEVFAIVPRSILSLAEKWRFYVWDEHKGLVRWVTSFDTSPDDIAALIYDIKAQLGLV